jgi:hypothetical protein
MLRSPDLISLSPTACARFLQDVDKGGHASFITPNMKHRDQWPMTHSAVRPIFG